LLSRSPLLIFVVSALLAVAGCGGKSKDDVIADGDEICREANEKINELNQEVDDLDSLATASAEAQDLADDAVNDLKDLDPPDEDREVFDNWIDKIEEQVDLIGELEEAAEDGDADRVRELAEEGEQIEDEANELARDYGFDDCSEDT
jgi:hypothetical protein